MSWPFDVVVWQRAKALTHRVVGSLDLPMHLVLRCPSSIVFSSTRAAGRIPVVDRFFLHDLITILRRVALFQPTQNADRKLIFSQVIRCSKTDKNLHLKHVASNYLASC